MSNFISLNIGLGNAKVRFTKWWFCFCFICGLALFYVVFFWNPPTPAPLRSIPNRNAPNFNLKLPSRSSLPPIPTTNFTAVEDKSGIEFWDGLKPSFKCPGGLTRVGHFSPAKDGDKWMCGVAPLHGRACQVYSFGVSDDSYFEAALLKQTPCSIFAYDPSVYQIANPLRGYQNPRLKFQKIGIGPRNRKKNNKNQKIRTLKTLMDKNGHDWIDILKIDVEGAEFSSLKRFIEDFKDKLVLPVGQILIEVHHPYHHMFTYDFTDVVVPLIKDLEEKGFRLFNVEKNAFDPKCCAELGFINIFNLDHFIKDPNEYYLRK